MRKRIFDISLSVTVGALIFGIGAGVLLLPKRTFSENENRMLSSLSIPTVGELLEGELSTSVGEFYRDHIPLREGLIAIKACTELALMKGENNGVLFCDDGYLLKKGEYESLVLARENLSFLSGIKELCEKNGVSAVTAFAPRGIDVMEGKLPYLYVGEQSRIYDLVGDAGIDLVTPIRCAAENGEYVWYRTDHHWTARGAYTAYRALSEALSFEPYGEEYFTVSQVSDEFFGSVYSSVGCVASESDSIELYRYGEDGDYTVSIPESGETHKGFYFSEWLSKKDKYAVFFGGNYPVLTVEKGNEKRERLLIIKDSFANSLAPFLALHFDIVLVDPRYYNEGEDGILRLIEAADRVLILCGIDTVASTRLY